MKQQRLTLGIAAALIGCAWFGAGTATASETRFPVPPAGGDSTGQCVTSYQVMGNGAVRIGQVVNEHAATNLAGFLGC